ncbi:MAG: hypothetical protein ABSD38_31980 [Syntrophorhabdales bacterium]|jgi:hypothetical protein
MKGLIVVSLIMAGMVLMVAFSTPAQAQNPANDLKPTFISPTPGLYVNGWPAFTLSYPKEWVEFPSPGPNGVFIAAPPGPDLPRPTILIVVKASPLPLEDWAKIFMPVWVEYADIKVLSNKPSQLKDGTPAWEVETESVERNGARKENLLFLATKKDLTWVAVALIAPEGKLSEDLKRIAYSLTFLKGREKPMQVPPDVRAFLDMVCTDTVGHDVKTIMAHFSDRFLHSGASKAFWEQWYRNDPASPVQRGVISQEVTVTVFEARGDKAYVDGFFLSKAKGDATAVKSPMTYQQIINEHGEWKWYGNQK